MMMWHLSSSSSSSCGRTLRTSPLSRVASFGVTGWVRGTQGFLGTPNSPCSLNIFGLRGCDLKGLL